MLCLPIGTEQWIGILTSQTAITFIVGAAAVAVSLTTFIYQRKQLKQTSLLETFRVLNLPVHREARKVTYGEKTHASYDILKITRPEDDPKLEGQIERVCIDMVKGDMNNAATLIYHNLMDESIFLEEYWWIVLRCWDSIKSSVYERRNSGTGALSYMRNLERLNGKAEAYAEKHFPNDFKEYQKIYRNERQQTEK